MAGDVVDADAKLAGKLIAAGVLEAYVAPVPVEEPVEEAGPGEPTKKGRRKDD